MGRSATSLARIECQSGTPSALNQFEHLPSPTEPLRSVPGAILGRVLFQFLAGCLLGRVGSRAAYSIAELRAPRRSRSPSLSFPLDRPSALVRPAPWPRGIATVTLVGPKGGRRPKFAHRQITPKPRAYSAPGIGLGQSASAPACEAAHSKMARARARGATRASGADPPY